jgi:CelD/BcsL family acetyltransferase involved in cellulose biosynthesis
VGASVSVDAIKPPTLRGRLLMISLNLRRLKRIIRGATSNLKVILRLVRTLGAGEGEYRTAMRTLIILRTRRNRLIFGAHDAVA